MSKPAFNLIEFTIVVGLLALLFALCLPSLFQYRAELLLDAAAKGVVSDLRNIQSKAQTGHSRETFNSSAYSLPAGIKFSSYNNLIFAPSGYPMVGGSGSITLINRLGNTRKIILSSVGRIRLE